MHRESIEDRLIEVLEEMVEDWELDLDKPIDVHTRLISDLGFTSVDLMQLAAAIEQSFSLRGRLPFEEILMEDGRYVTELDVNTLAGFLKKTMGKG